MSVPITVSGAGAVGMCLALLLAREKHPVILIDKEEMRGQDKRIFGLSKDSVCFIQSLLPVPESGLIQSPICRVAISQERRFARARFDNVDALGYVVPYESLLKVLRLAVAENPLIEVLAPAFITEEQDTSTGVEVKIKRGETVETREARCVIHAEGGAKKYLKQYKEYALSAIVELRDGKVEKTAFERFTEEGIIALLPLDTQGLRYSLTWCRKDAQELCEGSKDLVLARLQQAFGWQAGRFVALEQSAVIPLRHSVCDSKLTVGNASQMLHPAAAQGLNLGLRDVREWMQLMRRNGAPPSLQEFQKARFKDRRITMFIADFLATAHNSKVAFNALSAMLHKLPVSSILSEIVSMQLSFGWRS